MPNRDTTGPLGQGPMSGGAFGNCGRSSFTNRYYNMGLGQRLGRGFKNFFGINSRFNTNQIQDLENYISNLELELSRAKSLLSKISNKESTNE
jgi:hypothetical protein